MINRANGSVCGMPNRSVKRLWKRAPTRSTEAKSVREPSWERARSAKGAWEKAASKNNYSVEATENRLWTLDNKLKGFLSLSDTRKRLASH